MEGDRGVGGSRRGCGGRETGSSSPARQAFMNARARARVLREGGQSESAALSIWGFGAWLKGTSAVPPAHLVVCIQELNLQPSGDPPPPP